MQRTALLVAVILSTASLGYAGCVQDFDQFEPVGGGQGGSGAASSATTGTGGAGGGTGGAGVGTGGGGTGGSAPSTCNDDNDCPEETPECTQQGQCVECVWDGHCAGDAQCVDNVCVGCRDGVKNGDETDIDCGGSCRNCNGEPCGGDWHCASDNCVNDNGDKTCQP
ncbi:hypothetical protein [Polyangium aurulentum]|uniref:hypothetical protein n=1 Tax=Polyangium aurulentum TaxID=2567896 RepID=UPI0010ADDE9D|nr:hypothetical protein [Polyangium aurulentum]UQA55583.1 hypothetical protein E8A73_030105 [Polyangium aurulentum]